MIPFLKEATTGFEPVIKVLQTYALPLGYVAEILKLIHYTMGRKKRQEENFRKAFRRDISGTFPKGGDFPLPYSGKVVYDIR